MSQSMQHRMVGCLMDNELETIWHEAVVVYFRVKVKVTPWHAFTGSEKTRRYKLLPIRNPSMEGGKLSSPRSARFTPGKYRVPTVQEALFQSNIPELGGRTEPWSG